MPKETTPERVAFLLGEVIDVAREMNPDIKVEVMSFSDQPNALVVTDGDTWEEVEL